MIVKSRAPMRMGIAGGGTDVPSYSDLHGGAVVNAAINVFAYCEIKDIDQDKIVFQAADHGKIYHYPLNNELGGDLILHQAVYEFMINEHNGGNRIPLKISTFCEVPQGSGLGGSSALCVAIIKAFLEYFNVPMDDYSLSNLAHYIEREVCGLAGGKQDQIASVFGGFNFIQFNKDKNTIVTRLRLRNWIINEIESNSVLFFTGVQRNSSEIIEKQISDVSLSDEDILSNLHNMKREAFQVKDYLIEGDFEGVYGSIQRSWEEKSKTNQLIVTESSRAIFEIISKSEVRAAKISGAGGGGYMFIFVPLENRLKLVENLSAAKLGWFTPFKFCDNGCHSWKISTDNA